LWSQGLSELGGATTQDGIFYQNSVAALALLDLLEADPQPPRDRVVEVRVEAPEDVDDVVIRYADDHVQYQNVKIIVKPGTDAWARLWSSMYAQFRSQTFQMEDELTFVCGDLDTNVRTIRECCNRASTSTNRAEWEERLTEEQKKLLLTLPDNVRLQDFELFRRIRIRVLPLEQIENEFQRRRASGLKAPSSLLSNLRDIAGGEARKRGLFRAPVLRRRLRDEFQVTVAEPSEWGLAAYRSTLKRLASLEIPGAGISGSIDAMFVWPRAAAFDRTDRPDFEDENPLGQRGVTKQFIDLRVFPSIKIPRAIVIAGPGFGKSALLKAVSAEIADGPYVPVIVPLASLAASGENVPEFLEDDTNREFDIKPDWRRLAELGLLTLLFDGLDELPAEQRPSLLKRLRTFSARYPHAPWLMTVRDGAVLAGIPEALEVELLPLETADIERFVRKLKPHLTPMEALHFVHTLESHGDLIRLARIPLFLTMLIAMVDKESSLPTTRAALIESYLKTLFSPTEYKETPFCIASSPYLRDIAEYLAFERLEKQEIGASEKEVRDSIAGIVPKGHNGEHVFQCLLASGILKRQSAIRLQFPFPIVQEYLAACYLVHHRTETIADHIQDAVRRPWAQVIQFAIELSANPEPLVRAILEREDDAFCTSVRLVARCVANGATVLEGTRKAISEKLTTYWRVTSVSSRERVGALLLDGFSRPPGEELLSALHQPGLLNFGGGEIVSRLAERKLTLSVLDTILQGSLDHFSIFHSLKRALNAVADDAFKAIAQRILALELDDDKTTAFEGLLSHFSDGSVKRDIALSLASNETLPSPLRLEAYRCAGAPVTQEALALINVCLRNMESSGFWPPIELLALHPDRDQVLLDVLHDPQLSIEQKKKILSAIPRVFLDIDERIIFLNRSADDSTLDPELPPLFQLFSARYGNDSAFRALVERLKESPLEVAGSTISLFGHHQNRELAMRAAELVRERVTSAEEALSFASSAVSGMLYLFEMDFLFSGGLDDLLPHPGIDAWQTLLLDWSTAFEMSKVQQISILTKTSQLGSAEANKRLHELLLSMGDPNAPIFEEDKDGHVLSSAFAEVRLQRPLLPLDEAERLVRTDRMNVPRAGVGVISAHGTREALDVLLRLYHETDDWFRRDMIATAVESLSAKLDVPLVRDGRNLIVRGANSEAVI
jgi:NACHT domain